MFITVSKTRTAQCSIHLAAVGLQQCTNFPSPVTQKGTGTGGSPPASIVRACISAQSSLEGAQHVEYTLRLMLYLSWL